MSRVYFFNDGKKQEGSVLEVSFKRIKRDSTRRSHSDVEHAVLSILWHFLSNYRYSWKLSTEDEDLIKVAKTSCSWQLWIAGFCPLLYARLFVAEKVRHVPFACICSHTHPQQMHLTCQPRTLYQKYGINQHQVLKWIVLVSTEVLWMKASWRIIWLLDGLNMLH